MRDGSAAARGLEAEKRRDGDAALVLEASLRALVAAELGLTVKATGACRGDGRGSLAEEGGRRVALALELDLAGLALRPAGREDAEPAVGEA
jgi:hypothetical protein